MLRNVVVCCLLLLCVCVLVGFVRGVVGFLVFVGGSGRVCLLELILDNKSIEIQGVYEASLNALGLPDCCLPRDVAICSSKTLKNNDLLLYWGIITYAKIALQKSLTPIGFRILRFLRIIDRLTCDEVCTKGPGSRVRSPFCNILGTRNMS